MKRRYLPFFVTVAIAACGQRAVTTRATLEPVDGQHILSSEEEIQAVLDNEEMPYDTSTKSGVARDEQLDAATEELDAAEAVIPEAAEDLASDPAPELPDAEVKAGAFFVRVQWGNPKLNPAGKDTPIDYSGSITADADDVLRRARSWRFEGEDMVERPRPNAYTVNVASKVYTLSDGLHTVLLTKDNASKITITLGGSSGAPLQYSKSFDLNQDTVRVRDVSDSATPGQKVRVAIDRIPPRRATLACKVHGRVLGRWLHKETKDGRDMSLLVARAINEEGKVVAHLGGIAGMKKDGQKVFFMKVIGKDNQVIRVKGEYDAEKTIFGGKAIGPRGAEIGKLGGNYALPMSGAKAGAFEGVIDLDRCPDRE